MEFKYFWPNFDTNNNIFTEMIKHYDIPLTSKITMISCFNNKKDFCDNKVVYWVGENFRPLDWVDLNLTFDNDGDGGDDDDDSDDDADDDADDDKGWADNIR